jgi:hypothetical protein
MPASGKSPKKTESKAKPAAVKKTTTKSAAAKSKVSKATTKSKTAAHKAPAKAKKPAMGGGGAPMVDTSFAAESAARMLAARMKLGNAPAAGQPSAQHESGLFKQMKDNLNKPAAGGISSAMGNTFGPSKSNLPNPDKGHVVRDQTTSNVNRINVPRRTGG